MNATAVFCRVRRRRRIKRRQLRLTTHGSSSSTYYSDSSTVPTCSTRATASSSLRSSSPARRLHTLPALPGGHTTTHDSTQLSIPMPSPPPVDASCSADCSWNQATGSRPTQQLRSCSRSIVVVVVDLYGASHSASTRPYCVANR